MTVVFTSYIYNILTELIDPSENMELLLNAVDTIHLAQNGTFLPLINAAYMLNLYEVALTC
jgi:hypothetical protein